MYVPEPAASLCVAVHHHLRRFHRPELLEELPKNLIIHRLRQTPDEDLDPPVPAHFLTIHPLQYRTRVRFTATATTASATATATATAS